MRQYRAIQNGVLRALVRRIHRLAEFVAEQTAPADGEPVADGAQEQAPPDATADWQERTQPGGPPEHWLELVRNGAPHLLDEMQQGSGFVRMPKPPDIPTSAEPPVQLDRLTAEDTERTNTQPEPPSKRPQRRERRSELQEPPANLAGAVDRVAPQMEQPERTPSQFRQQWHEEERTESRMPPVQPDNHLRLSPALPRKADAGSPPATPAKRAKPIAQPDDAQEHVRRGDPPSPEETVIVHWPERRAEHIQENRQDGHRRMPPAEVIQRHADYRPPGVSLPSIEPAPPIRRQPDMAQGPSPVWSSLPQNKPVLREGGTMQAEEASLRWPALPGDLPQANDADLRELLRAQEHLQRLDREQQGIEGWNERHF